MTMIVDFKPGDQYARLNAEGDYVVWARQENEEWLSSDISRGVASDRDVEDGMSYDGFIFARGTLLADLMDEAFGAER